MAAPYTPHDLRKQTAFIYAKHTRILRDSGIPMDFWNSEAVHELPFVFLSVVAVEDEIPIPAGLPSLGRLSRGEFNEVLSSVKAVVGLGVPRISPTVFAALYVHFIN